MSLMDEFKKIIHPYDDEDYDYETRISSPPSAPARSPLSTTARTTAAATTGATRW